MDTTHSSKPESCIYSVHITLCRILEWKGCRTLRPRPHTQAFPSKIIFCFPPPGTNSCYCFPLPGTNYCYCFPSHQEYKPATASPTQEQNMLLFSSPPGTKSWYCFPHPGTKSCYCVLPQEQNPAAAFPYQEQNPATASPLTPGTKSCYTASSTLQEQNPATASTLPWTKSCYCFSSLTFRLKILLQLPLQSQISGDGFPPRISVDR